MRRWRCEHKQTDAQRKKSNCRTYLHIYIKRGKVVRGSCIFCQATSPIEAHHEDYSRPLAVDWVCRGHRVMLDMGLIRLEDAQFRTVQ